MDAPLTLAGVDLAWQSEKNGTSVAIGELDSGVLTITETDPNLRSLRDVKAKLDSVWGLRGIAIDAPLIMKNGHGQRPCEKHVGTAYGSRKASCHTSNLSRYPDPASVQLSQRLQDDGFVHLGQLSGKWQIECYPHPALIEIFGLPERHAYKKGRVTERRAGQTELSRLLLSLADSKVLPLRFRPEDYDLLSEDHVGLLRGAKLKQNEDWLDSIVCLYIAGLYAIEVIEKVFGNVNQGYIYVPRPKCERV